MPQKSYYAITKGCLFVGMRQTETERQGSRQRERNRGREQAMMVEIFQSGTCVIFGGW